MKLFAIYIGGEHPGANIEVHDMRFIAASSIEATYDALREQWWGKTGSLHIDCWSEISHADGYDVSLRPEPYAGQEKLYYVNLGGYDGVAFAEQHRNVFVVAETLQAAKRAPSSWPQAGATPTATKCMRPNRPSRFKTPPRPSGCISI